MQTEQLPFRAEKVETTVKLQRPYARVLKLLPALQGTFVLLVLKGVKKEAIVHCDKEGKILFEKSFRYGASKMEMLVDTQVIVAEPRLNQLTLLDLKDHSVTVLPFNFMFEESEQVKLFGFASSGRLCVVEHGRYQDNRLKLNYFDSPLTDKSTSICEYETQEEWTWEWVIRKGNEHSMVIWNRQRQDKQFQLRTYSINQELKGCYQQHSTANTTAQDYGWEAEVQAAILSVWQVREGQFCLVCATQKNNLNLCNEEGLVNNNYIWNTKDNKLREVKYLFGKYQDFTIEVHSIGKWAVFHTYNMAKDTPRPSPVFFIDQQTEKVAAITQWTCHPQVKLEFSSCYKNTLVMNEYSTGEVDKFICTIVSVVARCQTR